MGRTLLYYHREWTIADGFMTWGKNSPRVRRTGRVVLCSVARRDDIICGTTPYRQTYILGTVLLE